MTDNTTKTHEDENTTTNKFLEFLYNSPNLKTALENYAENLRNDENNILNLSHANKIDEYINIVFNRDLSRFCKEEFSFLSDAIDEEYPDIFFQFTGRRKSTLSFESKIQKLLKECKSLDLLRDILAFRILILTNDPQKSTKQCYDVANLVIKFFTKRGFTICDADPIKDTTSFDNSKHNIYVPESSGIDLNFTKSVKDYVATPKENGYQSIHLVFRTPTGDCFELQIRSISMHEHAEHGYAEHKKYKMIKYDSFPDFDPTKIKMDGFKLTNSGNVLDFINLVNGLIFMKNYKYYHTSNFSD